MSVRVVTSDLKPAEGDEDYRLHLAALEWSLAEPIIINSADDIDRNLASPLMEPWGLSFTRHTTEPNR